MRRLFLIAMASLLVIACESQDRLPADISIPERLRQHLAANGQPLPVIEKATYAGRPAFTTTATDRFDTGDEHSLFSEDGKLICRYGGFVGEVTSGSCELDQIEYVSTLYDPDREGSNVEGA